MFPMGTEPRYRRWTATERRRSFRTTRIWPGIVLALLCGCSAVNTMSPPNLPQTPEQEAQEIEPMLDTAGFQSLPASSPEQKNRLRALPSMKLGYYMDKHGAANYWLADPDFCACLFHGDQAAYDRFRLLRKDNQTAENDRRALQAQRYQQPFGGWGPPGAFGPGVGFGFGPGLGFGGGFGFSL